MFQSQADKSSQCDAIIAHYQDTERPVWTECASGAHDLSTHLLTTWCTCVPSLPLARQVSDSLDILCVSALVLDEDGTCVDTEEFFQTLPENTVLMVLEKEQKWTPHPVWCNMNHWAALLISCLSFALHLSVYVIPGTVFFFGCSDQTGRTMFSWSL